MQLRIIAIGKPLDRALQSVQEEYEQRLLPHIKVEWQLLPPAPDKQVVLCRDAESNKIMQQLKTSDTVILLDERGQLPDNEQFAERFTEWVGRHGRLVFVIGGAYGVNAALRARADFVWSLSPLVFPHRLVRIILVEQLYRTQAVLSGHPYHHG